MPPRASRQSYDRTPPGFAPGAVRILAQVVVAPPLDVTQVNYLLKIARKRHRPKKKFLAVKTGNPHPWAKAGKSCRMGGAINPKNP